MIKNINQFLCRVIGVLGMAVTLTACAGNLAGKPEGVGASVYSLNYSAKEVEFIAVEAPDDPNNSGGGESLTPYSGGGQVCCFGIPATWTPALKVVVVYQLAGDKDMRRVLTSVPPYPEGRAGDIWLIVRVDESAEAVISHFEPSRSEWPGTVKGYPVASREYRLKLWGIKLAREKRELAGMTKALKGDTSDLTPVELTRLERAIQYTQEEVKRLEENKP